MVRPSHKTTKLSVAELNARYDVERAHTMHVTALALRLFDLTGRAMGLRREHRRILEAAAMLHDVGFSGHPSHHAEAGARLLLKEGLAQFSRAESAMIAALVMLHSVRYKDKFDDPLVRDAENRDLVLRLAAYLRIADGLDSEHLQNATLVAADTRQRTVVFTVRCRGRDRSVRQADRKADLWREVFDRDVRFVSPDASLRGGSAVISAGDTVPEAARRLMYVQYKNVRTAEEGLAGGETAEPLHDLRVSIRRLRALLWIFRKPLSQPFAANLDRDLAAVSRALAPARDLDVWIEEWESLARGAVSGDPASAGYTARLYHLQTRHMRVVRRTVRSKMYVRLCSRVSAFIRTEVERKVGRSRMGALCRFALKQFDRSIKRMKRREDAPLDNASEALHAYRKAVRRARYVAEFLSPVLPPWGSKAERVLTKMSTELGQIHDLDVGIARLAREFPAHLDRYRPQLLTRRERTVACLKDVRRRCHRKRWYQDGRGLSDR